MSEAPSDKPKRGPPYHLHADEATLKIVVGLGQIQATWDEAAAVLGVSKPTFWAFLEREPAAKEAFERGQAEGRVSVKRAQFQQAMKGNVGAQIWWGKQYLDQKEPERVIRGTGPGGSIPIFDPTKLGDLSDEELAVIEKVFGRLAIEDGTDPETLELSANKEETDG